MKDSLLKQAEKNVVNVAKDLSDLLELFTIITHAGNRFIRYEDDRKEYFRGMEQAKQVIYKQYVNQIVNCFTLVGVGGDEALNYSREKFKERFNPEQRYMLMDLLEEFGTIPKSYKTSDELELRQEAEEKIKEMK